MSSILNDVKQMCGIVSDYDPFDAQLIMHINSVFTRVYQLGVGGQSQLYQITGADETWEDFFGDTQVIPMLKTYVYLKTRLYFDPPQSGVLHEAMERQVEELEWCLNVQAETPAFVGSKDEGG